MSQVSQASVWVPFADAKKTLPGNSLHDEFETFWLYECTVGLGRQTIILLNSRYLKKASSEPPLGMAPWCNLYQTTFHSKNIQGKEMIANVSVFNGCYVKNSPFFTSLYKRSIQLKDRRPPLISAFRLRTPNRVTWWFQFNRYYVRFVRILLIVNQSKKSIVYSSCIYFPSGCVLPYVSCILQNSYASPV